MATPIYYVGIGNFGIPSIFRFIVTLNPKSITESK